MGRLIDADELMKKCTCKKDCKNCDFFTDGDSWCKGAICGTTVMQAKTVDAAPVVRCKDCKYREDAYCKDHKTISKTEIYCYKDEYRHGIYSDSDKAWYKEYYGIKYSDAYEVYGLTRTGCCGCPISYKAVEDLEKIRPYEPVLVKAAWNVFGDSYRYRQKYNEYKEKSYE